MAENRTFLLCVDTPIRSSAQDLRMPRYSGALLLVSDRLLKVYSRGGRNGPDQLGTSAAQAALPRTINSG
jgi:hypothetical protein